MADGSPSRGQDRHLSTLPRGSSNELLSSSNQANLARGSTMPTVRRTTRKDMHNMSFPTYSAADSRPPDLSRGRLATEDVSIVVCLLIILLSPVSIQTQSLAFLAVFVYAFNARNASDCVSMEIGLRLLF